MELSNGGKESLDKETFKKGLNKLEACGLKNNIDNTPFADRLFHLLDINGDGSVDLSEFVCGLSMLCKGSVEEKLECMFLFNYYIVFLLPAYLFFPFYCCITCCAFLFHFVFHTCMRI